MAIEDLHRADLASIVSGELNLREHLILERLDRKQSNTFSKIR